MISSTVVRYCSAFGCGLNNEVLSLAAQARQNNIKAIAERMFFSDQVKPFINMMAAGAIFESKTAVEPEELTQKMKENIGLYLHKFSKPLDDPSFFTDEELHELRLIHENPVLNKVMSLLVRIGSGYHSSLQEIRDAFKKCAADFTITDSIEDCSAVCVLNNGITRDAAQIRKDDMKVFLKKSFFPDSWVNQAATDAIAESGKVIDPKKLIQKMGTIFDDHLSKFSKPFDESCTDEEIHELRLIYENPVWDKHSRSSGQYQQEQMQGLKEAFKELSLSYKVAEKTAPVKSVVLEWSQEDLLQRLQTSKVPVILDISAKWCQPCHIFGPIFESVGQNYIDQMVFATVDFDLQQEALEQFEIASLPTVLIFQAGQPTLSLRYAGFMSKQDLKDKIDAFLKDKS